jgi:glycosyltransferase involved in cell wall biosynthesis
MPGKRAADLLGAVRRLKTEGNLPFTVVMAGSGQLEQELRAFCTEHALDNVVFTGFVNQLDLPALYGASDIFVLPSEQERPCRERSNVRQPSHRCIVRSGMRS